MTKASKEIQQKVEEKFDGLTKSSKAPELHWQNQTKTGKMKSRVYIRPHKAANRQVRGHWRKTMIKLLRNFKEVAKKEPAEKNSEAGLNSSL